MKTVIHPSYFPNVAHFVCIATGNILLERWDNYQKQTYRNRMYLYGANGKQLLSVPVKHLGKQGHQKYHEVRIDNSFNWQKQHWKTIQTAYRTSPFFEFYEDDIAPIYKQPFELLMELNLQSIQMLCELIDLPLPKNFTSGYQEDYPDMTDGRKLINAKTKKSFALEPYVQVFGEKHGFIPNLSILDLLFNLGPNASEYLSKQQKPV